MSANRNIQLTASPDSQTVAINVPETALVLNATDVDNLIAALAVVRSNLQPGFPDQPGNNREYQATIEPRYWVMPNQVLGGTSVGFRHPGLGWIWFCISNVETSHLSNILKSHNAPVPSEAPASIN